LFSRSKLWSVKSLIGMIGMTATLQVMQFIVSLWSLSKGAAPVLHASGGFSLMLSDLSPQRKGPCHSSKSQSWTLRPNSTFPYQYRQYVAFMNCARTFCNYACTPPKKELYTAWDGL
jgi:hypothetical protein